MTSKSVRKVEIGIYAILGICFIFVIGMFLSSVAFGDDGDITDASVQEVRADVTNWKLNSVKFLVFTKTIKVTYSKAANGTLTGEEVKVIFRNRDDDPETPEDETLTEFTDVVNAINNNDNIRETIRTVTKIKLDL